MFKNVTGQKIQLFAFDITTGAPKTGDAANITAYVSKDHGSVTILGDTSATEMDATNAKGVYVFDLTQAETNADELTFTAKSSTANISITPRFIETKPANFTAFSLNSSGQVDVIKVAGTTQTAGDIYGRIGDAVGSPTVQTLTADIADIKLLQDTNLDAPISSRLAGASYTAPDNSTITAIYSRIGAAVGSPSAQSLSEDILDIKSLVDAYVDAPISTRLASASYTAPDNSSIASIKTVTDVLNLMLELAPGSPTYYRFKAGACELVWDVELSAHLVSGSTGFALNAAGSAGDPWSTALPGAYGAGTAGFIVGSNLDAAVSTRLAGASYTAPDNATVANIYTRIGVAVGSPSSQTISDDLLDIKTHVDAYLDATISSRLASASYIAPDNSSVTAIKSVTDLLGLMIESPAGSPTYYRFKAGACELVWDVELSAHLAAGSTGSALNAAGAAGDPWSTALPGSYGAGTAGSIIGNTVPSIYSRIGAEVGSPSATVSEDLASLLDAVSSIYGVEVSIKTKTDALPSDPADASDIAAQFTTVNNTLSTIASYVDTEVAAIKAKTDNLPATPASTSDVTALLTTQMVESYASDGTAPTLAQALFMIWSLLAERSILSTTLTAKKLDGTTTSMTFTLDDATNPTAQTRSS